MTYNPEEVGYDKLVDLFYSRHNSTTPNRAGNDVGTQYRSGIYYHTDEQKQVRVKQLHILAQTIGLPLLHMCSLRCTLIPF